MARASIRPRAVQLDLGHIPDQDVRNRLSEITVRKAEIDSTAWGTTERHFGRAKIKIERGDFEDD